MGIKRSAALDPDKNKNKCTELLKMDNLIKIYICPMHGEVDGAYHEEINTSTDEIIPLMLCDFTGCTNSVTPKTVNGVECYREMSPDEKAFNDSYVPEDFEDNSEVTDWEQGY